MNRPRLRSSAARRAFLRRVPSSWLVAVAAAAFAAPTVASQADAHLTLLNGAELRGTILKQTSDGYFIDLGYEIVRIPVAQVAEFVEEAENGAEETTVEAPVPTESAAPADGLIARNEQGVSYFERAQKGAFDNIGDMVEHARLGVVHIKAPSKRGTGFVIDRQGYIVSNFHVVEDERFLSVTTYYREGDEVKKKIYREVELVAFSPLMDISLLHINDADFDPSLLTPLPIAASGVATPGTVAVAIGNPGMGYMALDHTISEGIVSSQDRNFNDILYLQTTAAVNPGNSGGPLINANGEVIGLVTYKAFMQDNIGFAMPSPYIRHFIERQQGYAYPEDKLNTGVRYLPPM